MNMHSADMFSFITNCVLTYNYPLVHSMSEEEIADIFKTSNRCFLISWMLKLLDSAYEEILENCENDMKLLGNIVYELGFCTGKEKLLFMTGELPVTQQVKIIYNIFTYITDVKKYNDEENTLSISCDEITNLVNTDLNLFPMYGDIMLLRESERISKKLELEKIIEDGKVDQLATKSKDECNFKEDIQEFLDNLKIDFPKIKFAMENFANGKEEVEATNVELKSDSVKILKKCCENLNIISQFIKDINTIEEFEKDDYKLKQSKDDSTYEMIKVLHREVFTTLKYIKCL